MSLFAASNVVALLVQSYPIQGSTENATRDEKKLAARIKNLIDRHVNESIEIEEEDEFEVEYYYDYFKFCVILA